MKRELTEADRDKIIKCIEAGDRIEAISSYISITECGLTQAQKFIKALTLEIEAKTLAKEQKK
jgi:hypothetical protein